MWKLLPVEGPRGAHRVRAAESGLGRNRLHLSAVRRVSRSAAAVSVAAYSPGALNVTIDGRTEPTTGGELVSGGYFPLLGVPAGLGRLLGPDDDRVPMGHPVAVISDGYWRRRFARDPGNRRQDPRAERRAVHDRRRDTRRNSSASKWARRPGYSSRS